MRKSTKVFASIIVLFVLMVGGFAFYMTRGLDAGEAIALNGIKDIDKQEGVYSGKYDGGRWSNEVIITIKAGKIEKIDVKKAVLFERPEITQQLFDMVVKEQNTGVDGISGATVTCRAYLKSIENALDNN